MRWVRALPVGHPAMVIHVEGFDWNCPQPIPPRYTVEELMGEELMGTLEPVRKRMEDLEAENARLRGWLRDAGRPLR